MADQEPVAVILARVEVKLDQALSSTLDHEGRIRTLESRGYVSGKQLWAALLGLGSVVTAAAAVAATFLR